MSAFPDILQVFGLIEVHNRRLSLILSSSREDDRGARETQRTNEESVYTLRVNQHLMEPLYLTRVTEI